MLPCPQTLLGQCAFSNHFLQLRRIEAVGQKCCDTSERQSHFGRHVVRQGELELGCITIISRCPLYPAESAARCDGERHRPKEDLYEHFVRELLPHFHERRISFGNAFRLCFEQEQPLLNPSVHFLGIFSGPTDKEENAGQFKKETEREEHHSPCRACVFMFIQLLNGLRTERVYDGHELKELLPPDEREPI